MWGCIFGCFEGMYGIKGGVMWDGGKMGYLHNPGLVVCLMEGKPHPRAISMLWVSHGDAWIVRRRVWWGVSNDGQDASVHLTLLNSVDNACMNV